MTFRAPELTLLAVLVILLACTELRDWLLPLALILGANAVAVGTRSTGQEEAC